MNTNLNKWEALLQKTEYIGSLHCISENEFATVTEKYFFHPPAGYEEFLRVFGPGEFGGFVDIYWADIGWHLEDIGFLKDSLSNLIFDFPEIDFSFYQGLLDHCFGFGGSSMSQSYLWDLRTYCHDDQSYDIYLAEINSPDLYLVGRDFFHFIQDYCLGDLIETIFDSDYLDARPRADKIFRPFTR